MLTGCAAARCLLLAFVVGGMLPVNAAGKPPLQSPAQLVRRAVDNEVSSNSGSGPHFMFKDVRTSKHFSQTKLLVETTQAMAGMVIAQDGHPLSAQQRRAEESRLENYVRNPDELNKKRKQEKEDTDRSERILRALPDAFLYTEDGTVPGSQSVGRAGDELVRLAFRPNPNYNPPTRVEQVLTGMAGHLLIDVNEYRVAEIDGTLQKDVGFGWGILGHLDSGGRFLVQQADVGDRQWEVTHMQLSFTGKILFFKKLSIQSNDVYFDFRMVPPNLTFAQGVELLRKEAAQIERAASERGSREPEASSRTSGAEPRNEADKELCCDR